MNLKYRLSILLTTLASLTACNESTKLDSSVEAVVTVKESENFRDTSSKLEPIEKKTFSTSTTKESMELTSLVREVYEWHAAKRIGDFPYKFRKQNDSIFTGLDWEKYNKNIEEFRKTGFFTDKFLFNHKAIAITIDSSIRKSDITWRNIRDGIPIWDTGADDWCVCQDYPDNSDNYWELITIDSLNIKNSTASFYWTWDKEPSPEQHKVRVTAVKSGDKWRINSLEGFKYFGSVADYDKVMKN
ncbi:hypothetical protein I5M27_09155 [Adhaeribacter sp. BT258]|uniref:DUF3828 domain-containing protein n=1 Tax=Adhaeribacter terrigena TaxID=2793070 RepID=A0ABS1C171_9BACT|nr:hypothetical protein [Adhaeribacter terrigena]MBK0403151.1 hypothetical protein [Adhaeribacter terrigena]